MISTFSIVAGILLGGPIGQADAAKTNVAQPPDRAAHADAGWTPLFNGHNLDGWYTFLQEHGKNRDPEHIITIENETIHLYKHASDGDRVVMGYISTEKEHGDYHLRFQYRWGEKKFEPRHALKRDGGLYYHLNGPDAIWPRGLQYQIEQTNVGDLIALFGFQLDTAIDPKTRSEKMPTFLGADDGGERHVLGGKGIAYLKHRAGTFERDGWNTVEIIARGASTTHILNGQTIATGQNVRMVGPEGSGKAVPVTRGRIALEIEAAELFYRNVEIKALTAGAAVGQ